MDYLRQSTTKHKPPLELVLRTLNDGRRTVAAVGSMQNQRGEPVMFVRVGVQFRNRDGDWRWSKGEGVTIPLSKLEALAAWLNEAARATFARFTHGAEQ